MAIRTKAQEYLEKLQERIYAHLVRWKPEPTDQEIIEKVLKAKQPFMTKEEIDKLREELIKEARGAEREMPTRFEIPAFYSILLNLAEEIEGAAKDLSFPIPVRPLLGTLPTGEVNACTIPVPESNEYIVAFMPQICVFMCLLSKAAIRVVRFDNLKNRFRFLPTKNADIEKKIVENPDIVQRFQEAILAYLLDGWPASAPQYILAEPHQTATTYLLHPAELFVMGHEYGHITRGHLSTGRIGTVTMGEEEVQKINYDWSQEFEADHRGLELMAQANQTRRGTDLALSFWGADFLFSCMEVIERGLSILHTGKEERLPEVKDEKDLIELMKNYPSHPPTPMRRAKLRMDLIRSLPGDPSEGAIELGMTIEKIVEVLWERTRPILHQCYKSGRRPAPLWIWNKLVWSE